MPPSKPVFASGDPSYALKSDFDVDLAPTGQGVPDALAEAIQRINRHTSLSLTMADFDQKVYAIAYFSNYTSKNEPVAWVCDKEGKFDGEPGTWHVEMSMDDPTVMTTSGSRRPDGPGCPHIGYEFYFLSRTGRKTSKKTGHILLKSVPSSRPKPSDARTSPLHTRRT